MQNKTHYKKLRNPHYIGSYELLTGHEPIELVVTIESALKELVQNGDKKEEAMVLYLKGQKPMIVNSTNAKAIEAALGSPYIEDWVGRQISLYVAKIRAFGENVDALRVRKEAPKVVLPDLPLNSKTHTATLEAIKSGKTTFKDGLSFLQQKYTLSQEIVDSLEKAEAERGTQ